MPVFTQSLKKIDTQNPAEALRDMANHIRYIQEQLEWTLMNLDSTNIKDIDLGETNVSSGSGGTSITGSAISLKGKNGEVFEAGTPAGSSTFTFSVKGKGGTQMMYLASDGTLVITNNAAMHIDGGTW